MNSPSNVWRIGTMWGSDPILDLMLESRIVFWGQNFEFDITRVEIGDLVALAEPGHKKIVAVGQVGSGVVDLPKLLRNHAQKDLLEEYQPAWGMLLSECYRLEDSEQFSTASYQRIYSLGNDPDAYNKTIAMFKRKGGDVEMKKVYELMSLNLNVVLTGAPGTGKTFLAQEVAEKIAKSPDRVVNVQFHPSYGYSDFVEGLRPVKEGDTLGFERQDGIFMDVCRKAIEHPDDKYVVIIDEINRGDISKIFGELFSLIEKDYRTLDGMKDSRRIFVKTQYNNLMDENDIFKKGFFVPPNVYIIGTMNDVDRSVESMDFAIRRRFVWHEVTPEDRFDAMWGEAVVEGVERDEVKSRMNALNEKIRNDSTLGEAYQIGPSYFMKMKDLKGDYDLLWNQSLRFLLKEYLRGMPDAAKKLDEFHSELVGSQGK